MNDTKKYLGARIQELRKKLGLTQAALAELVEIDPKHMSKIECGRCFPSFELLDKIAYKMNVPIGDFFVVEHLHNRSELISDLVEKLEAMSDERFWLIYKTLKEIV